MRMIALVAALTAAVLSGAALAVSVTHAGPAGPAGRAGDPGRSAEVARLGICWNAPVYDQTWADGSVSEWVSAVEISQPVLSNGVYTCPQGETFTSIVPAPASSSGI